MCSTVSPPTIPDPAAPLKERSVILPMLRSIKRPIAAQTSIHNTHGDVVLGRFFAKRILFVCDPAAIEQLYGYEGKGLLNRDFIYEAKKTFFGDGLVNSRSELWSKQRRLLQPWFTKEAVKSWEPIISAETRAMIRQMRSAGQTEVDLSARIKLLIQRIFIRILLGRSVDELSNSAELIRVIDTISQELLPQLGTEIMFGRLKRFLPLRTRRYKEAVAYLRDFIQQQIDSRPAVPGRDMISLFMQAEDRNTGYKMSEALLQDEAVNLFYAGQDTTINTLLWFFYLTGKHAEVREKVGAEVRALPIGAGAAQVLNGLPYTKAVIQETLRLYPPTSALSNQTAADIRLGRYSIPKGTTIMFSMYATHRNPRLWDQPDSFDPERFTGDGANRRPKYAYFPFGGGLHNCLGRHFVELEMLLVIAEFFREFNFDTDITLHEAIGITLKPDRPLLGKIGQPNALGWCPSICGATLSVGEIQPHRNPNL